MASTSGASPDDDGYKRFADDIHNVSYGSNSPRKFIIFVGIICGNNCDSFIYLDYTDI